MSAPPQLDLDPGTPLPLPPPADGDIAPVWLQRLSLAVLVLFCFCLGVVLAVFPWSPRFWDHNVWVAGHPALAAIMRNGAVRGFVSGLGIIDIWIGLTELVHYRDYRGE